MTDEQIERGVAFFATFLGLHILLWGSLFCISRLQTAQRGDGEGLIYLLVAVVCSGPLCGMESVVGYPTVTLLAPSYKQPLFRTFLRDAAFSALLVYSLGWSALAFLRKTILAENIMDSYLGLNLFRHIFPWSPIFLGGLSALVTIVCSMVARRSSRRALDSNGR
ncbi:MAG TPA: hypothetical protein VGK48_28720 [Terriglobia bacterium]|jgi:hypothetical protein